MTKNTVKPEMTHVGRPPELEKKEPKVAVRELAIHEGNRAVGEMFVAGVNDLIVDFIKEKTDKWGQNNVIKVLIRFAEFRNEHTKEQEQGKEHNDNMKILVGKTLGMYRKTRAEAALEPTNTDVKKYDQFIGVLEYLEASYTGDAKKLVMLKERHPHIATFVEKIILKNAKDTSKIAKTIALEAVDGLPFFNPESTMEFPRLAALQLVSTLFNQHPDVAAEERIPLTKGGVTGAFHLQQERMRVARQNFSLWQSTKDFWASYKKFVKTGKFV